MKKFFQQGLMMAAGIFVVPATMSMADQSVHSKECRADDPRLESLKRFFHSVHSPLERLASVFISEADEHELDWRLLPGLSFVESTGGKSPRGNNIFGWNNGNSNFRTISEGIHVVASRLANAPMYRGKDLVAKLRTYNQNPKYVACVRTAMKQISADDADDE
jgi:hypothetical protein